MSSEVALLSDLGAAMKPPARSSPSFCQHEGALGDDDEQGVDDVSRGAADLLAQSADEVCDSDRSVYFPDDGGHQDTRDEWKLLSLSPWIAHVLPSEVRVKLVMKDIEMGESVGLCILKCLCIRIHAQLHIGVTKFSRPALGVS